MSDRTVSMNVTTTPSQLATTPSQLVRQKVREHLQQQSGTPQNIADTIRMDEPDLYDAYMRDQGWYLFQRVVADMMRNIRSVERDRRHVDRINAMLKTGDTDVVSIMDVLVDGIDGLMRVGEMTRSDHIAAAVAYEMMSDEASHYAKVHRNIASKLKQGQRTQDRFTEDELRALYVKYEGGQK